MYAEILHLKYDNGEMDQLPARRVEPEEYLPPSIGSRVCCKVKGAKYSAEIVAIEITTPTKTCHLHVIRYRHYYILIAFFMAI